MEEYREVDQGGEGEVVTKGDLAELLGRVFGKVQEELSGLHTDIGNLGGILDGLAEQQKTMGSSGLPRTAVYATIPATSPFAQ